MALTYASLAALVNTKYLPEMPDVLFRNHALLTLLKAKKKSITAREIHVPLEYSDEGTVEEIAAYGTLTLREHEPFTAARYTPEMAVVTCSVSHEDLLHANDEMAVHNLVTSKLGNVQKSLDKHFSTRLYYRSTISGNMWNSLDALVSNSGTIGGIAVADASWWKSPIIDAADMGGNVKANLEDPTSDAFLFKIVQRAVAAAKYQSGEKPDLMIMPTELWNLLEYIYTQQKLGSKLNEKLLSLGFTALDYHGTAIVADDDMVLAQTSDTDGRIYTLNTDYLYMFMHPDAAFKMGPFVEHTNALTRTAKITCYGNIVISNRTTCVQVQNLYSQRTYANVNG